MKKKKTILKVYVVSKDDEDIRGLTKDIVWALESNGGEIESLGIGSAYNMPWYLLERIEEDITKAMVVSIYMGEEGLIPMGFGPGEEVEALAEGLRNAEEGQSSMDILLKVHKEIREN